MVHNKHQIGKQHAAAMSMLTSETGLSAMQAVLTAQCAQNAAVVGAVSQVYWHSLLSGLTQPLPHMFKALGVRVQNSTVFAKDTAPPMSGQQMHVSDSASPHMSSLTIESTVQQLVVAVLGKEEIQPDQPLATQGMDSLAGLELRQKLQARGVGLKCLIAPCSSLVLHDTNCHADLNVRCRILWAWS